MLQASEFRPGDSPRRVLGRWHLERRTRGLLVAVSRFQRCRARTPDELAWCARTIDGLTELLDGGGASDPPQAAVGERRTADSALASASGASAQIAEGFRS